MTDSEESEFDDGELVLVEGETLELRMQYLKWCDLAYQRLMVEWFNLAFCLVLVAAMVAVAGTGTVLITTHASDADVFRIGQMCIIVGVIGIGVPIGGCARAALNIRTDRRIFVSYMRSARENVVMRRVDRQ